MASLNIISNQELAMNLLYNDPSNTLVIVASSNVNELQPFIQCTGGLVGSILTPSYDAFMCEIEGNMDGFYKIYFDQLNSEDCISFIAVLFKGVATGKNIYLYITPDEMAHQYPTALATYFANFFGISIGMPERNIQFGFYPNYAQYVIAELLYLYDLEEADTVLNIYGKESVQTIPFAILRKLMDQFKPNIGNNKPVEAYEDFFLTLCGAKDGRKKKIPCKLV